MGLVDLDGVSLKDRWADGVSTYLGMTVPRFPNLFIAYGPQVSCATALLLHSLIAILRHRLHSPMAQSLLKFNASGCIPLSN